MKHTILLIAALTMGITFFATRWIDNLLILLIVRILVAGILYFGILWLFGAKILKECIGFLLKRK